MEGGMDMSFITIVVDAANLTAVVTLPTPYTNYTIKMAASTSVGRGEFGREVTVQTNESSKPGHNQLASTYNVALCEALCNVDVASLMLSMVLN